MWFGVDVGGTSVKTALVSVTGEVLHKVSFATRPELGQVALCRRIHESLEASLVAIGAPAADVKGIGVGVPAFLDDEQRIILDAVNLGWKNVAFAQLLEDELGLPTALDNDANLAALGEAWVGAGIGAKSVLCVTVGTGVGAGVVLDGKLYRGVGGMAGEIGHLTVEREHALECNCGKVGCLETRASATAMVRRAREEQARGSLPLNPEISGAKEVFEMAGAGQEAAQAVIQETAHWLGYGLALAAMVLNPDAIVIGGGVSKAGRIFLDPVEQAFRTYTLQKTATDASMRLAQLGNDAGVIGAARLIAQKRS